MTNPQHIHLEAFLIIRLIPFKQHIELIDYFLNRLVLLYLIPLLLNLDNFEKGNQKCTSE